MSISLSILIYVDVNGYVLSMNDANDPSLPPSGPATDAIVLRDLRSLSETAYETIEAMIVTGELSPNMLLSESELARQLGCGRTPVREALQRLSYEGFVDILPRRGVMVTHFDVTQQLDLLEMRRPMEELMVRLAARRASLSQREMMRAVALEFEAAVENADIDSYIRCNRRAVHLEAEATGNALLQRHMSMVHGLARRYWYGQISAPESMAGAARCHCSVLRAVAAREEDAAASAANALIDFLDSVARRALHRGDKR